MRFAGVTVQSGPESTELITSHVLADRPLRRLPDQLKLRRHNTSDDVIERHDAPSLDYAVEVQLGRSAPLGRKVDRQLKVGKNPFNIRYSILQ